MAHIRVSNEGRRRLEDGLARTSSEPSFARYRALNALSTLHWEAGDYQRSLPLVRQALDVARRLDRFEETEAQALLNLAADLLKRRGSRVDDPLQPRSSTSGRGAWQRTTAHVGPHQPCTGSPLQRRLRTIAHASSNSWCMSSARTTLWIARGASPIFGWSQLQIRGQVGAWLVPRGASLRSCSARPVRDSRDPVRLRDQPNRGRTIARGRQTARLGTPLRRATRRRHQHMDPRSCSGSDARRRAPLSVTRSSERSIKTAANSTPTRSIRTLLADRSEI